MADRLRIGAGANFAVEPSPGIFSPRLARQRQTPLAEMFLQKPIVKASEITHPPNAQGLQVLLRNFSHTWDIAHVERSQKLRLLAWE